MRMALFGAGVAICAVNCAPGGTLEVGPVRVTESMGSGSLAPAMFPAKALTTITIYEDFCDMPSEQQLSDEVLQVGNIDFSKFVQLSHLNLVHGTLTATAGNFDFMTELTVSYVPSVGAPGNPDPVVLGTANNPGGLGTEVTLIPPDALDVLDLIRQNDANTSGQCPKLRYDMTVSSAPASNVQYDISMTVDAFALVGLF